MRGHRRAWGAVFGVVLAVRLQCCWWWRRCSCWLVLAVLGTLCVYTGFAVAALFIHAGEGAQAWWRAAQRLSDGVS